jgi:hypothetical protein
VIQPLASVFNESIAGESEPPVEPSAQLAGPGQLSTLPESIAARSALTVVASFLQPVDVAGAKSLDKHDEEKLSSSHARFEQR